MQTVTSVRDRVIETVKPMVTTVVEKTAPVLTSAIEGTIRQVERIDPEAAQRESFFKQSSEGVAAQGEDEAPVEERKAPEEPQSVAQLNRPVIQAAEGQPSDGGVETAMNRLKVVTEDLLDLWLHEGSRGVRYV